MAEARRWAALLLCIGFVSCSQQTHKTVREERSSTVENAKSKLPIAGETIPPNHCRLTGTVVAIDPALVSGDSSSPCSRVPCNATVRIDSIIGYGSAFGMALHVGEKIPIHFVFTLGATKELFKNMTESYPGLQVGTKFNADVESTGEQRSQTGSQFTIYGYQIQ